METTYAAHITGDKKAEVMKNEGKVILYFHTQLDNLGQRLYRSNPVSPTDRIFINWKKIEIK